MRLFESIQHAFPRLTMRLERQHPHVELNMDIPCQPGLTCDVNVNLQGDEFHLGAGALLLSWFPCTGSHRAAQFLKAVHGVLSGRSRIVEHLRGRRVVRAELQSQTTAAGKGPARPEGFTCRSGRGAPG